MENEKESSAKKEDSVVWRDCPVCRRANAVSPQFKNFLSLVYHLIDHLYHLKHPRPLPSLLEGDDLSRYREALRRNPRKAPSEVEPLPPYDLDPLAWREPSSGKQSLILPEAKPFLPVIADWLKEALNSAQGLECVEADVVQGAPRLIEIIQKLPDHFQEQRDYLLAHREALEQSVGSKDRPRQPDRQAKFLAESIAGAKWGLKPSSSREYVRQERPKTKGGFSELGICKKEGRWWDFDILKKDEEEKP